ncbi:MAG TPA: heavy metal-binding domain-containing protein [Acidimicrobiales bacterium]|nr:heavy metal-binding domain-containing protein [Acidimicrobiales bacterium]
MTGPAAPPDPAPPPEPVPPPDPAPAPAVDLRRAMAALTDDGRGTAGPGGAGPGTATGPGAGRRGSTSDLSVDEVLLLHSVGWEPVDVVFGVSWWSVPWGTWQWQTGEVREAARAFDGAMGEATELLRDECAHVGGSGVVGVDIELRVASHHVDLALTGTAVRRIGDRAAGFEFVSDLSARDFALLTRAGWWPVGLAAGASFVIAPRRSAREWAAQQGQNTELPNLTNALYLARENAMEDMQRTGLDMGADGIVHVKLREGPLGHSARIVQFVAFGTGVCLRGDGHQAIRPDLVVSLDDRVREFDVRKLRNDRRR